MKIKQSAPKRWWERNTTRAQSNNYANVRDAIDYLLNNDITIKAKKIFQIIKANRTKSLSTKQPVGDSSNNNLLLETTALEPKDAAGIRSTAPLRTTLGP